MSKPNPIVERAKALRATLEAEIASLEVQITAKRAEAAVLDRLMIPQPPEAPKPDRTPRTTRKVPVSGHTRQIGTPEPGEPLPLAEPPP